MRARILGELGQLAIEVQDYQSAEQHLSKAVALLQSSGHVDDVNWVETLTAYGNSLSAMGRNEDAIAILKQSLAERIRLNGETSSSAVTGQVTLAAALAKSGQNDAAAVIYEGALAAFRDHADTTNPLFLALTLGYADLLERTGQTDAAGQLFDQAADMSEQTPEGKQPFDVVTYQQLANRALAQDRLEDASSYLASAQSRLSDADPALSDIRILEGHIALRTGELDLALQNAPLVENGQWLKISPIEEQPYAPYDSAYQITQLAPESTVTDSTDVVREPNAALAQGSELAVAAAINQDFRLDRFTQIGILLFEDGQFNGYQMAGKTEAFSQEPVLGTDHEGNLHVAWREGGQGNIVYYAVTEPEARSNLDRIGLNDIANFALSGGIEVITGVLFFPLACVWLFPGLFLIGVWHYWRGESDMDEPATIVVLVISIIVSLVMKFLFLPTITTYVPFSAWVDISARWETALRFLVPVITMGIGLLVAWRLHRRTPSALAFFFWFIAADAVLTLAIYGVTFLGVF